jgi:homoserine kinase type II
MAVYTEVSDVELAGFIANYGLGELQSYKGIAEGVENTNYLVQTARGPFILTLYEKRVARDDLPFFLGLMEHLASKGVSCPTPMHDAEGRNLADLAGRAAAIVTFLQGVSVKDPTVQHCAAVGRALAELHLAGQDFGMRRANALGPQGWRPLFAKFAARADEVSPGLGEVIAAELTALEAAWPRDLPRGVIHADLFPDNVFFLGGRCSGLIDFYFACNDFLAYDIAICLNAWCFDRTYRFDAEKGRAMLVAYDAVRPLTPGERDAMPLLARGAAMRFLLTRAHDWLHHDATALVSPHDPIDYVHRLHFHQTARSIADYGLP